MLVQSLSRWYCCAQTEEKNVTREKEPVDLNETILIEELEEKLAPESTVAILD